MKQYPADQNITLRFDFLVGGDFVVPDTASYVIRGNTGTVIDGPNTITLSDTATWVDILVPASLNSKTLPIEKRLVEVTFVVEGVSYVRPQAYYLVDALPLLFGAEQAFGFLGLDAEDMPPDQIDMLGAYYALKATMTAGTLDAGLNSTDPNTQLRSNWAIVYKAITLISPQSLKIRLNQIEKSDATSFTRFKDIDFDALIADAAGRLDEIVGELDPVNAADVQLLVLTQPTDVFTG